MHSVVDRSLTLFGHSALSCRCESGEEADLAGVLCARSVRTVLSSAEAEVAVCGGDREGLALTLVRLHNSQDASAQATD